jgi:hypothetical protein
MIRSINPRAVFSLGLLLVCVTGCSAVSTIIYFFNPNDTPAAFKGLEEKKTVVVCRAESLEYSDPLIGRELAGVIGRKMEQSDKKLAVVEDQKLADWTDRNDWSDYRQVGKALKADMVVGVDIERFAIRQGPTLLQGQADVRISVYDIKDGGKKVWEYRPATIKFPPNAPIPSSERQEAEFRRQFIDRVAEEIAHNFYAYNSRDLHALDSTALK